MIFRKTLTERNRIEALREKVDHRRAEQIERLGIHDIFQPRLRVLEEDDEVHLLAIAFFDGFP